MKVRWTGERDEGGEVVEAQSICLGEQEGASGLPFTATAKEATALLQPMGVLALLQVVRVPAHLQAVAVLAHRLTMEVVEHTHMLFLRTARRSTMSMVTKSTVVKYNTSVNKVCFADFTRVTG